MVIRPDQRPGLLQAFRALMLREQAARGLISCRLLLDSEDANTLYFVEDWRTTADFEHQVRSAQYTRLLTLMEQAIEPPKFQLSWVSEVRGLEYLESLRLNLQ